ncbi:MAG: helix-turn-helix domain-containing protein [Patescibacteria group bacterium]|nr:helix-turn-helix domain-containing protein [Patescibacteria group bacterium]
MTKYTSNKKYMTVEQVAEILQVHWQTILHYIRKGQLHAFKIGKGYRITDDDLDKFIRKLKEGQK